MGSHYVYKIFRKIKIVKYCKNGQITYIKQIFWCANITSYEILKPNEVLLIEIYVGAAFHTLSSDIPLME